MLDKYYTLIIKVSIYTNYKEILPLRQADLKKSVHFKNIKEEGL